MEKIFKLPLFIKDSFIRAWKGEEKLWKVFWGWGILGQIFIFYIIYIDNFFIKLGLPFIEIELDIKAEISILSYLLQICIPLSTIVILYFYKACTKNVKSEDFVGLGFFLVFLYFLIVQMGSFINNLFIIGLTLPFVIYYIFMITIFFKLIISKK